MSSNIKVSDFIKSSSLVSRESARQLFDFVSKSTDNNIVLDFSNIYYASRSFFAEWNSHNSKLKLLGKNVEIINLDENLSKLNQIVVNTSLMNSSLVYTSLASAQVINL